MPLSSAAIEELKAIYRDEFGEVLSDDAALAIGERLLRIYGMLTRPRAKSADPVRASTRVV